MYRVTVIAGPSRGSSFSLNEGENWVGRQPGNAIVLSSTRVSKKHCALHVRAGEILLSDLGSSNGTFVNGALVRNRKLKKGDRISVGEFVLELAEGQGRVPAVRRNDSPLLASGAGSLSTFGSSISGGGVSHSMDAGSLTAPPRELKDKILWFFENKAMTIFYGLLLKYEWKVLGGTFLILFVVANLMISVSPVLEFADQAITRETRSRAAFMARQIVERNSAVIAARSETRTDLGLIPKEVGVRVALLVDLEGRIIAPASRMNSYLTDGPEAKFVTDMRAKFREGTEKGSARALNSELVGAIEPLKVLNPAKGANEIVAMAIVSIDTSVSKPNLGGLMVTYSQTLIFTGVLGLLLGLVFYRLTLKPFEVLNDDLDKVLKGDLSQVTQEFKVPELDSLWDVINSALQRLSRSNQGGSGEGGGMSFGGSSNASDEVLPALQVMSQAAKFGMVGLDAERKIVLLNPAFEDIAGIRSSEALGSDLPSVARDQAFAALVDDMMNRASPGSEGVTEEFEFSGVSFRVIASAFGNSGASAKAYLFCVVKSDG